MKTPTWTELLQFSRSTGADVVPKEFKTRQEIQKHFNLGQAGTAKVLRKLILAGKVEIRKFRVAMPTGVKVIPHYKAIK